jgi:hypothetical protein
MKGWFLMHVPPRRENPLSRGMAGELIDFATIRAG